MYDEISITTEILVNNKSLPKNDCTVKSSIVIQNISARKSVEHIKMIVSLSW